MRITHPSPLPPDPAEGGEGSPLPPNRAGKQDSPLPPDPAVAVARGPMPAGESHAAGEQDH